MNGASAVGETGKGEKGALPVILYTESAKRKIVVIVRISQGQAFCIVQKKCFALTFALLAIRSIFGKRKRDTSNQGGYDAIAA
jgi:hypothetical protein